jgi:hypothetical protein
MALTLDKSTIVSLGTIRPWHVSQSVDAFTGLEAYDITISGSLTITGSVYLDQLSDTPQNNVLSFDSVTKQVFYTSSQGLTAGLSSTLNDLTASYNAFTGSHNTGSFTGSFTGSVAGTAATASYVNLVAGPNITINQVGTAFQISGSGGGSGYTTVENEGSPLTQRTTIDFVGAGVDVTDAGGKTVVTITGASGSLAAAGNNYEIQYNSGSELAAAESFRFNYLSQSLEQGAYVTASGLISHAEGAATLASGQYSHAEGAFTLAQGTVDHAEGYFTTASSVGWGGNPAAAHAEGSFTKAFGAGSHAEGSFTITSASAAHAEGVSTLVIGPGSHAEGYFTTASGQESVGGDFGGSHSEGLLTFASASFSHAEGFKTISKGVFSHAEGSGSIAEGAASHAEGRQTLASGLFSHTEGYLTTASGIYSHAEGLGTVSSNTGSHAYGFVSLASGEFSFAGGIYSTASGDYSVALGMSSSAATIGTFAAGVGVKAESSVLTAFGTYNQTSSISNTSYGTFVVGGGVSDSARANLFRVSGSGQCLAAGTFTNGGADYAEYFESYDGQSIPLGTVVELTGSYIKICEIAENAIGVISNKPSVLGNSDEGTGDEWIGKYEKDIWGNYVMEEYDYQIVSHVDEDMNITYKTLTGTRKKLNLDFNPALQYTPREQRPEWNIVGLLGQIRVLKNQQIPPRWIKMKELNDEIAIYLIK